MYNTTKAKKIRPWAVAHLYFDVLYYSCFSGPNWNSDDPQSGKGTGAVIRKSKDGKLLKVGWIHFFPSSSQFSLENASPLKWWYRIPKSQIAALLPWNWENFLQSYSTSVQLLAGTLLNIVFAFLQWHVCNGLKALIHTQGCVCTLHKVTIAYQICQYATLQTCFPFSPPKSHIFVYILVTNNTQCVLDFVVF